MWGGARIKTPPAFEMTLRAAWGPWTLCVTRLRDRLENRASHVRVQLRMLRGRGRW